MVAGASGDMCTTKPIQHVSEVTENVMILNHVERVRIASLMRRAMRNIKKLKIAIAFPVSYFILVRSLRSRFSSEYFCLYETLPNQKTSLKIAHRNAEIKSSLNVFFKGAVIIILLYIIIPAIHKQGEF